MCKRFDDIQFNCVECIDDQSLRTARVHHTLKKKKKVGNDDHYVNHITIFSVSEILPHVL